MLSEGSITLADDKLSEATLLIDLSWYAWQRHIRVIIYIGTSSIDGRLNLLSSAKYPDCGAARHYEELLMDIATKHYSGYMLADVPTTEQSGNNISKLKLCVGIMCV